MMKGYQDAYQVLQTEAIKEITSSRKLDQLIKLFQNNFLKAWDYRSRLKRHLQPVALMNELLRDLNDYLQQIQQREELQYNDEKTHMPVSSKIKFMMEEDNRIKTRLKGIIHFCRLRSDDFILTAVHMAEYWALDDLYWEISKDRANYVRVSEPLTVVNTNNSKMSDSITVFISYSWDNEKHKQWVLNLAYKLAEYGIYVILDRYDLNAGKQMTHFMERGVNAANKVLLIMTPKYKEKADNRTGGVGFEYSMITQELYVKNDNNKFIPIRREGNLNECAPTFLGSYIAHDMSDDNTFEKDFVSLLRLIYDEPEIKRPPLGKKPTFEQLQQAISFNPGINEAIAVKPTTFEEHHQNLISRIEAKRNVINLQSSSAAIECVTTEVAKFKYYFNERSKILEQNKFDRYSHSPFIYCVHKSHIAYGEYLLELEFYLPGMVYDGIVTTQDALLIIELSKISRDNRTKTSIETENRLFFYTPELQGWALPDIHENPTNRELQLLFSNRYTKEYYDLDQVISTEALIDKWMQKLLSFSSEGIEKYIKQVNK